MLDDVDGLVRPEEINVERVENSDENVIWQGHCVLGQEKWQRLLKGSRDKGRENLGLDPIQTGRRSAYAYIGLPQIYSFFRIRKAAK